MFDNHSLGHRGRNSGDALSVSFGESKLARLPAPKGFTAEEKKFWDALTGSRPVGWFSAEHIPLMEQYCRHRSTAKQISDEMAEFTPAKLKKTPELVRYNRLSKILERETNSIVKLATKMRLTQQATYNTRKAHTMRRQAQGMKPWQRSAQ